MPDEVEDIVSSINKDLKQFYINVENHDYNGLISIPEYNLYKEEIEVNIRNILQDKNFYLAKFQWQT